MITRPPHASFLPAPGKKIERIRCLPAPLSLAIACLYSTSAQALPQNPTTVSGKVSITTANQAMQVNQTTNKAIIEWQKFGVASNESVTFNQPSRASVILNRVSGMETSALDGMLNATGQVFIVNPNGVLIGPTARVNAGGLLASTLAIENQRFLNSDFTFAARSDSDKAPVGNAGSVTAVDGGYVILLANNVRNSGTIDAPAGHVLMGAGSKATLYLSDQSLLGYRIDAGSAAALVENAGRIRADGGKVTLAASGISGASQLASAAVNHSGIIEAKTLNGKAGAIVLSGDMQAGRVSVTGRLDASAQAGVGGTIDTSAAVVAVGSNASISTESVSGATGLWTATSLNPVIGGDRDSISNTVLANALDKNNVTVSAYGNGTGTSGSLSIAGEIDARGKHKLVVKATHDVLVAAPVTVGSGGFAAWADSDGSGEGAVKFDAAATIRGNDGAPIDIYTNVPSYSDTSRYDGFITSPYRLWMLVNNAGQLQDMQSNLSGNYALGRDIDAAGTAAWNGGAGFRPIGLDRKRFDGQLDGMSHVISNLTINRPRNDYVGLFSEMTGTVMNLGLRNVHVTANSHAGAFAGYNGGTLKNVYATGSVSVDVERGYSEQSTNTAGGLVGSNGRTGAIRDAYSLVDVGGDAILGGIAGTNEGTIDGVYAAGKVGRPNFADELFGIGGIAGINSGPVRNTYWTTDGTGKNLAFGSDHSSVDGGNSVHALTNDGLRTAELGLDFDTRWFRYDGYTAPLLRSFLKPLTIDGISREVDKIYDSLAFDFQPAFLYSIPEAASSAHLNSRNDATRGAQGSDVGTYSSGTVTTFWSDQQGYLIRNPIVRQKTIVAIHARPIVLQATADTKYFDDSIVSPALPGVSNDRNERNAGLVSGDVLDAVQSFDAKVAGDRTLSISSVEIKNSQGKNVTSNYEISRSDAIGKIVEKKADPIPEIPVTDGGNGNGNGTGDGSGGGTGGGNGGGTGGGNGGGTGGGNGGGTGGGNGGGTDGGNGGGTGGGNGGAGGGNGGGAGGGNGGGAGGGNGVGTGGGTNGGLGGGSGNGSGGTNGGANGGNAGGTLGSPADRSGEQQRSATLFAYLGDRGEDELKKRSLENSKLRNAFTLSIRDGGIRVPGETAR